MRELAIAGVALTLLGVGCGGSGQSESSTAGPMEVLTRYVAAVRAGDAATVMDLLSEKFVDYADLTVEKVETSVIPAVRSDWGPVGRSLAPAFERRLSDVLAVAALKDRSNRLLPGPRALAEPLVREDGDWKVEPFGVDLSYGYPDDLSADATRPFVTFGVNTTGDPEAHLWIDGRELPLTRRPGSPITFEGRPSKPLARGRHVVVAFARVGERVGALAWVSRI